MTLRERLYHSAILFSRFTEIKREDELVKKDCKHYFELMRLNGVTVRHLTSEQKKQVDEIYGRYKKTKTGKYNYLTHELYLSATGEFEPAVVPEVLFRNHINYRMNSAEHKRSWVDKNYYELLHPDTPFPEAILHCINGKYLDPFYAPISKKTAQSLLCECDKFIVKPSIYGAFGTGVRIFPGGTELKEIVKIYKRDFIVQRLFRQHPDMNALNESSVNVVRLITVLTGDQPEVLMAGLRVGNVGALTDYSPTKEGTGSVILGVREDGTIRKYGYNSCGKQVTACANGCVFEGRKVPDFEGMCRLALRCHAKMPMFRFVAWDMVCDAEGKATVMEYNLVRPGVLYYQWANGPLFGKDPKQVHRIIDQLRK